MKFILKLFAYITFICSLPLVLIGIVGFAILVFSSKYIDEQPTDVYIPVV